MLVEFLAYVFLLLVNYGDDRQWWCTINTPICFYTDPLNKSFCNVNSSAKVPAKSSSIGFDDAPLAVSVSTKHSQSLSIANDGIGLSLPTELAFELALCRKSGDNWKFPLFFMSFEIGTFRGRQMIVMVIILKLSGKKGSFHEK